MCKKCGRERHVETDADGHPQEPHQCAGCERQGTFTHAGELSSEDIDVAMQAGESWRPPTGVSEERHGDLWDDIRDYISEYWATDDERNYDFLTAWAMSTWFRPNLDFSSHLMLMGKTTGGKTRLLRTLSRVAYRTIVSASATPASMFRLVDSYNVSFLVSEYHGLEHDSQRMLDNVVRAGQKRDETVTRAESSPGGGFVPDTFNPFTHVAVATQYVPDPDIVNRCIQVRSSSPNRAMPLRFDEEQATDIRNRMLYERWRLHDSEEWRAAFNEAVDYCAENGIIHRTREKVVSLLTVAILWDKTEEFAPVVDMIVSDDADASADSEDANVMAAIRNLANQQIRRSGVVIGDDEDIWADLELAYSDVVRQYNDMTGEDKSSSWLGHVMKRLGLGKKRKRAGTVISDPNLKEKLQTHCDEYGFDLHAEMDAHELVKELHPDDVHTGPCSECGETKPIRFKHVDGYHMCADCGATFEERRDG